MASSKLAWQRNITSLFDMGDSLFNCFFPLPCLFPNDWGDNMFATEQWVTSWHWLFAVFFWGGWLNYPVRGLFHQPCINLNISPPVRSFEDVPFSPGQIWIRSLEGIGFRPVYQLDFNGSCQGSICRWWTSKTFFKVGSFQHDFCCHIQQAVQKLDRKICWIYSMFFCW